VIGFDIPTMRLGDVIRPLVYSTQTGDHWIRHNIEETGRSGDVIPARSALSLLT
jgi:hypothetical protein